MFFLFFSSEILVQGGLGYLDRCFFPRSEEEKKGWEKISIVLCGWLTLSCCVCAVYRSVFALSRRNE